MSIITVWNDNREQSGRTLTAAAVATRMAIERNSKILLISTSVGDSTIKNCFFGEDKKNEKLFDVKKMGKELLNTEKSLHFPPSSSKKRPTRTV